MDNFRKAEGVCGKPLYPRGTSGSPPPQSFSTSPSRTTSPSRIAAPILLPHFSPSRDNSPLSTSASWVAKRRQLTTFGPFSAVTSENENDDESGRLPSPSPTPTPQLQSPVIAPTLADLPHPLVPTLADLPSHLFAPTLADLPPTSVSPTEIASTHAFTRSISRRPSLKLKVIALGRVPSRFAESEDELLLTWSGDEDVNPYWKVSKLADGESFVFQKEDIVQVKVLRRFSMSYDKSWT